jgi:hypothetical protein
MPRIEYTLSFENYLELTSSRREKKDFRIAATSAILGFICIASGYFFLKIRIGESFFPGGLLIASGLVLTFLAMLLGLLAKPKSSKPDLPVLRREYDLYHADKRAIEFDEHGWRVFWHEGEDVRPWACLRELYDLETLLVLGTLTTHYWLPKTALQRAGQLEPLKALAESFLTNRQKLFQVPLRPSARVYLAAKVFHNWRRQPLPRLLCLAALTLVGYWIISGGGDAPSTGLWALAVVPVCLSLSEALFYIARYYTLDWSKGSQNAEMMTDCIGYKTKTIRWIAEYRRLMEIKEIPGAFMLYFDLHSYHLIPKRSFSAEQIAQFKKLSGHNRQSSAPNHTIA